MYKGYVFCILIFKKNYQELPGIGWMIKKGFESDFINLSLIDLFSYENKKCILYILIST